MSIKKRNREKALLHIEAQVDRLLKHGCKGYTSQELAEAHLKLTKWHTLVAKWLREEFHVVKRTGNAIILPNVSIKSGGSDETTD